MSFHDDLIGGTEIDWKPETLRISAWLQHVPFAFWIISALRPRCVVELGTHTGVSYFAFCQAVERLDFQSICYAVDTWRGDEHAGSYGEEIFNDVNTVNEARYKAFSTLLRTTFDDSVAYFSDGEIDLLHIDGLHTYEAVSHDFETWRCKLSPRGVVVFHDINVRRDGFGVWKLWAELSEHLPSFRFDHGHGLGVLGVGEEMPPKLMQLFRSSADENEKQRIRNRFSARGEYIQLSYQLTDMAARHAESLASAVQRERLAQAEVQRLQSELETVQLTARSRETDFLQRCETQVRQECAQEIERLEAKVAADKYQAESALQAGLHAAAERTSLEITELRRRYWLLRKPSTRKLATKIGSLFGGSTNK